MRISDRQNFAQVSKRLQQAKGLTSQSLENLSTQRKLHKSSDDPIGITRILRNRGTIEMSEQYMRNIEYAQGFINKTEETIAGISDTLIRTKELAITAANGVQNEETRDIISKEVNQLIGNLIQLGNATYADKYIFGGFKTRSPVIDSDGNFMGDDGAIFLAFDKDIFARINLNGRELFEGETDTEFSTPSMISTVKQFYEHLLSNNVDALKHDLTNLDYHIDRSTQFRATIGSKSKMLEQVNDRLGEQKKNITIENDKIEGADFFASTSNFKQAETTLQSTLLASNKLLQPSLLNFMQ